MTLPPDFRDRRVPVREINAAQVLSPWYGPRSLACHSVEVYDGATAAARFVVPKMLCGAGARPPMYDNLRFENGLYRVETSVLDAPEHWLGLQVISGHAITGLVVNGLEREFYQGREHKGRTYPTGFDFLRFRSFTFPGQEISFTTETETTDTQTSATVTMQGQEKPFTEGFRCEDGDPIDPEEQKNMLEWDWILETTAQGMGVLGNPLRGVKPILIAFGSSRFEKMRIHGGDVITTLLEDVDVDSQNVSGDAHVFVNGRHFGDLQEVIAGFIPTEVVVEQAAKIKS